jgi:hypothetical protein
MELKSQWHRLDPATRRWLLDNPGCVVLPRTISTIVARVADEPVVRDRHGTIQLSAADVSFIRATLHGSNAAAGEHRFFDAVQPGSDAEPGSAEQSDGAEPGKGESGHLD